MSVRLFGDRPTEADVADSLLRFEDCAPEDSDSDCDDDDMSVGVPHRDCVALRRNFDNLQFVAVLQGVATFTSEARVTISLPPDPAPKPRETPVRVPAGNVIVFMGSRYAHAVTTAGKCLRVTGWVCARGTRVVDEGGAVRCKFCAMED